jgi:hypothetical protein
MLEPPHIERKVELQRAQWIGIPLLMVLPILALAGVLGDAREEVTASGGGIEMRVSFPQRGRQTQHALEAQVTNSGPT